MTNSEVSTARKKTFVHPRKRPPHDIEIVQRRVVVIPSTMSSGAPTREMLVSLPRLKCLEKPYVDE